MSSEPPLLYVQRFPWLGLPDRTNKFAVSFDNYIGYSIDQLKQLLASKFYLISNKPDSFLIWKQKFTRQSSLLFLLVDMDQAGAAAADMMGASSVLLDIIESEGGLVLRKNNRDSWITIQLPCGCDQERAPFPSLRQHPNSPGYEPFPGIWHDPNKCQVKRRITAASLLSSTTTPPVFRTPPTAELASLSLPGGSPILGNSTVASVSSGTGITYPHEAAATASQIGEIIYSNQFAYPTSIDSMYTPTGYTPLSGDSSTGAANPSPLPVGAGPSMMGVASNDFAYPHMEWRANDNQNESEGGGV